MYGCEAADVDGVQQWIWARQAAQSFVLLTINLSLFGLVKSARVVGLELDPAFEAAVLGCGRAATATSTKADDDEGKHSRNWLNTP